MAQESYAREVREPHTPVGRVFSLVSDPGFQTFCLTARTYLNMQKYGLFCSLLLKLHRNHKGASLNSLKISEMSLTILLFLTISSSLHVLCRRADLVKKKHFSRYILILFACALLKAL